MKGTGREERGSQEAGMSPAELRVMKDLWKNGPGTVRDVHGRLEKEGARWAYTTVLTLLSRLVAKGYVARKEGPALVFSPARSREGILQGRLKELAEHFAEGETSVLVQALMEGQRFSGEEIDRFRRLLDELEGRRGKPGRKP